MTVRCSAAQGARGLGRLNRGLLQLGNPLNELRRLAPCLLSSRLRLRHAGPLVLELLGVRALREHLARALELGPALRELGAERDHRLLLRVQRVGRLGGLFVRAPKLRPGLGQRRLRLGLGQLGVSARGGEARGGPVGAPALLLQLVVGRRLCHRLGGRTAGSPHLFLGHAQLGAERLDRTTLLRQRSGDRRNLRLSLFGGQLGFVRLSPLGLELLGRR